MDIPRTLSQTLLLLATTLLATFALFLLFSLLHTRRRGPKTWPLLGALLEFLSNYHRLHDYLTEYAAHYRTFVLPLPSRTLIHTADPRVVEYMLKTNFSNYGKGPVIYEMSKELFGKGIFNIDGEVWKKQRKIACLEFSSKILRDLTQDSFRQQATKLAAILEHESKAGRPVDLQIMIQRMTLDAISQVGFGTAIGSLSLTPPMEAIAFTQAFDYASAQPFVRLADPLWKIKRCLGIGSEKILQKHIRALNSFAYRVIRERRQKLEQSQVKSDLLSRFLALAETDPKFYTDETLRDMALNFMLAGRDTTAITLCWFFYSLCKNPEVEKKVLDEILASQGSKDSPSADNPISGFADLLDFETLSKMNYLQACLSETLRLYPSIPLDGKWAFDKDVLPDGTKVRKGNLVCYLPYAMGRMEWIWGKDALEFKPERWLKDGAYQQQSPFKFTAFQAGPRACMGKDFAYLQMKITAIILLRFFKFEIVTGQNIHYRIMLTLHMSDEGLNVNVVPRIL